MAKIAFISLYASSFFNGKGLRFGGAEKRAAVLSTWSALLGFKTYLVLAKPQKKEERLNSRQMDGVVPIYFNRYPSSGGASNPKFKSTLRLRIEDKIRSILGLPFISQKDKNEKRIVNFYSKLNANLFVGITTAPWVYEFLFSGQKLGVKTCLILADNTDIVDIHSFESQCINPMDELRLNTILIADSVVCQNAFQEERMTTLFPQKKIFTLNNPVNDSMVVSLRKHVLWIGKFNAIKNPLAALDLARLNPEIPFLIVANPGDPLNPKDVEIQTGFFRDLPKNVKYLESVSPQNIPELMASSWVFINTSISEGFPNTILEAATQETPSLCLFVNPNEALVPKGLGRTFNGDLNAMSTCLKELVNSPNQRKKMGESARKYVLKNHRLEIIKTDWGKILIEMLS
jgi:glycosyltransferase involved in cell wall biosynthesis